MPGGGGMDTVRRFIQEVVNQKMLDVIDEVFAEDVVHHTPQEDLRGRQAMRDAEIAFQLAFPDEHVSVDDEIAQDNRVALRWTWRGTHAGTFSGIAASGVVVTTSGITMFRLDRGRIAEMWEHYDQVGFRRQLIAGNQPKG
ncbi:MAG: ester cyclase [Thermoplasmata archaeon]